MLCPVCHSDMAVVEFRGVELDVCPACRGLWFDAEELRVLFATLGQDDADVEAGLRAMPRQHAARRTRCPRCRRRLAEFEAAAGPPRLVLDRCIRGHGLWFDRGELPRLLAGSTEDAQAAKDGGIAAVREFLGEFEPSTER